MVLLCQLTKEQKHPRDTTIPTLDKGNENKKFKSVVGGNNSPSNPNQTNTLPTGTSPTGTSPVSYILSR